MVHEMIIDMAAARLARQTKHDHKVIASLELRSQVMNWRDDLLDAIPFDGIKVKLLDDILELFKQPAIWSNPNE